MRRPTRVQYTRYFKGFADLLVFLDGVLTVRLGGKMLFQL
jgi:hypothetical protein